MAKLLKLRRGSTSDHSSFTGAEGEVTVDTDKDSLVVHDGSTAGGHPLAKSADITGKASLTGATFTGNIVFDNDNQIQFQEATSNGNAYVGLKAPTDMGATSSYTITLPNTSPGTSKVLKTDSSTASQLTWADDTTGLAAPSSAGTVDASKGVQVDANKDITGFRNVTLTGELDAATGDFSGDVDIDGTANLDAVDIDGAVQIDNTVTVGVNDTGYDVKFFGATAGAYMLWDEDVDDLILGGAARAVVPDGQLVLGSTAVTSTAAELNQLDGKTAVLLTDTQTISGSKSFDAVKVAKGTIATHGTTTGNIAFDFSAGNNQQVTLTGNPTFTQPTNQVAGQSGSIFIIQDAGGSNVVQTWHADWKFAGNVDPVLSTAGNSVDRLDYIILADNSVQGVLTKAIA